MRRLLLIIMITWLPILVFGQKEVNGSMVSLVGSSGDLKVIDKFTTISFYPSEFRFGLNIKNNSNNDIRVIWDKCSFIQNGQSSKIIFDTTIGLDFDKPLGNQEIPSQSFITKGIYPAVNLEYKDPIISKRFVKQRFKDTGKPDSLRIILAFKINGELINKSYQFKIQPITK